MATFGLDIAPTALRYLNGRGSPGNDELFISLAMLEKNCEEVDADVMLCIEIFEILYYRRNDLKQGTNFFNRSKQSVNIGFDRMVILRCLDSPPSYNVCTILIGKYRHSKLCDKPINVSNGHIWLFLAKVV